MGEEHSDVLGPIDYIVVEFPGNRFNGEIMPALTDLIARGIVRVLDLAIVIKDADGNATIAELEDFGGEAGPFAGLSAFLADLVSEEDLLTIAEVINPNHTAAILVWENTWAGPFASAVRDSGGELVSSGRLPAGEVMDALAELAQADA